MNGSGKAQHLVKEDCTRPSSYIEHCTVFEVLKCVTVFLYPIRDVSIRIMGCEFNKVLIVNCIHSTSVNNEIIGHIVNVLS